MKQASNVFEALQKYGSHAPENYLTEVFVYLLDLLLTREPAAGLDMINRLCGLSTSERLTEASAIKIRTQVDIAPHGIVDIEIQSGKDALFYVEVKLDSPLDGDQLALYREDLLERHKGQRTGMVFLARSRQAAIPTRLSAQEYHHVCWYEIYNWIQRLNMRDEVALFLTANFQKFMEAKSMGYSQIGSEYTAGISATNNLLQMLRAAISAALPKAKVTVNGGFNWRGYGVAPGYFCGIRFDASHFLVFERWENKAIVFKRDLNFINESFFALDRDAQFERIVRFLTESHAASLKPNP